MTGLAVFDLCDTLVAENTTVGFLRVLATRHATVERALDRWADRRSPAFWIGAIAQRVGRDFARERLVASLAGLPRTAIEEGAEAYAHSAPLNAAVAARLERHRDEGAQILILSSSLDPVVRAMAARLDVDGQGSLLGFRDDICTGRIDADLTGSKLRVAQERGLPLLAAYSDNRSDLSLLAAAKHGVLVIPRVGKRPTAVPKGVDEVIDA